MVQHAEPIERREGHGSPMYRYDRPTHEIHSSFSKRLFQVLQTGLRSQLFLLNKCRNWRDFTLQLWLTRLEISRRKPPSPLGDMSRRL